MSPLTIYANVLSANCVVCITCKPPPSLPPRHPGHLSPRKVSSAMKNKMFKGTLQQDAQEFLRCLLSQVHEEIGLLIPPALEGVTCGCGQESCDHHRNSSVSCASNDSDTSNDSSTKLVGSAQNSPNIHKKTISRSSSSPSTTPKFPPKTKGLYSKLKGISKNSLENIHLSGQARGSKSSLSRAEGPRSSLQGSKGSLQTSQVGFGSELRWREGEVFVANLETSQVTVHGIRQSMTNTGSSQSLTIPVEITTPSSDETTPISITETTPTVDPPSELDETCVCVMEDPSPSRLPNVTTPTISSTPDVGSSVDHSPSLDNRIAWVALREKLATKRSEWTQMLGGGHTHTHTLTHTHTHTHTLTHTHTHSHTHTLTHTHTQRKTQCCKYRQSSV